MPDLYADSKLFVLDDNETNLVFLEKLLRKLGYQDILCCSQPEQAEFLVAQEKPDLVITDLHMPGMDGYQVLERLRSRKNRTYLPILVFTADTTADARQRALELGATDFLTKPGDACEIGLRVKNFLEMRHLHRQLEEYSNELERKVIERTQRLQESQMEIVYRLALTAEYRDDNTGQHCQRVAELAYEIAVQYGLSLSEADLIRLAAPLHDIGKVGISDMILNKEGSLNRTEFQEIQRHTHLGAQILEGSQSEVLRMAHTIALSHHEKWDGQGYGHGLAGAEIPIAGRIVAVADVFDALVHERPYKKAWPLAKAVDEIKAGAGSHFDPAVVEAFSRVMTARELKRAA